MPGRSILNKPVKVGDLLNKKLHPTILMWNRLEGRPRTHDFGKALKAEVRDALWMLTKQWQMGEFEGEDAGSPVSSKIKIATSRINQIKTGDGTFKPLDQSVCLEALAEQTRLPFVRNGKKISVDIRLQLGRYWGKLLKAGSLEAYANNFISEYPFTLPEKNRDSNHIYAHKDDWQQLKAISGRCMDGYDLISLLNKGGKASKNIIADENNPDRNTIDKLGEAFMTYFQKNYTQPESKEKDSWLPDRLEYKFECSDQGSDKDNVLTAEEYYSGHLDWYAFNLNPENGTGSTPPRQEVDTFIPTNVEFDGIPDRRWWKFEDNNVNFSEIKPSVTDISKLLLIEFGLVFVNDWFLVPFTLPIGSLSEIQGLTVTNNFGETFWVDAAEKSGEKASDWSMFRQKSDHTNRQIFLASSAIKVQEGTPLEEIVLIRDEMANMVWAIEKVVPSLSGKGVQGSEYALQTRAYYEELIKADPADEINTGEVDYVANVYYKAMTEVPENWIPFIPVRYENHKRKIQLQRASMLRTIQGDKKPPEKIKPLTSVLRPGLDNDPGQLPYFIHEEEVPRSGVHIQKNFERTRWLNGEVTVWLGLKKKTGRGEGNSGLAFDTLENK